MCGMEQLPSYNIYTCMMFTQSKKWTCMILAQSKVGNSYLYEITTSNCSEHFIDGCIGRQCTVEDIELPLESLWNIITSATWMYHCSHHLDVNNVGELSRLLQVVETACFHQLPCCLVCHLKIHNGTIITSIKNKWHDHKLHATSHDHSDSIRNVSHYHMQHHIFHPHFILFIYKCLSISSD